MRSGCVVLLLLAMVRAAAADSLQEAKQHYERANAAYALGRFGEAAAEFEKAFDLKPDSALLYNAAQAYRIAGNKERALLLYQSYLRVFGDQVANADEARRHVTDLKQAIEAEKQPAPKPSPPAAANATTSNATTPQTVLTAAPPPKSHSSRAKGRAVIWGVVGGVVGVGLAVGLGVGLTYGRPTEPTLPKVQYP